MEAVFCERCGKIMPKDSTHAVKLDLGYNEEFEGDLCTECRDLVEECYLGTELRDEEGNIKKE